MVTGLESRLKAAVGKEQGKAPRVEEWYSTPQGKILSNVFSLFKMLPPHPTYSIPLFAFGAYYFSWQFSSWAVSLVAWFLLMFWGGCIFPVSSIRHFYKLLFERRKWAGLFQTWLLFNRFPFGKLISAIIMLQKNIKEKQDHRYLVTNLNVWI